MLASINNFSENEPLRTFCQRGEAKNPEDWSLCVQLNIKIIMSLIQMVYVPTHTNPVAVYYLLLL